MKKLLFTASMLAICITIAQAQKLATRTAKVSFNASASGSPEKIEGVNNEAANVFDTKSGVIAFQVLIKSFKFQRELMQEHFNENYMESDKFPKADFKGNVTNINEINFGTDGVYNTKVSGKLTIHGITNDILVPGTITVKGGSISVKAKFSVVLKDYNINIPGVVADKIGSVATIVLESELAQK